VEEAKKELGDFQILINNAATQLEQPSIQELTSEQLEDTFNTNIFSMFYIKKHTLPHLKGGAAIVNCASINHYAGHPELLEYLPQIQSDETDI
jgi:NAD(P)-dependent dehydrogenase (short-subunit alcohol dehydrogenase family)